MKVRFINHRANPGPDVPTQYHLGTWYIQTAPPVRDDYIVLGGQSWIVRHRIWRSETDIDVHCAPLEFDL